MATVTCNKCGAEAVFQPLYRREGDLELTFLRCPECGAEYLSSATDTPLRKSIEEYKRMLQHIQTGKATEMEILDAQGWYADNLRRSKTLRDEYLRQHLDT